MKNIILYFLLVISSYSYSQNIIIQEFFPDHFQGIPNREAAHSYYDSSNHKLYLTYMDKRTLVLKTYVDFKKIDEYKFDRTEDAGLFNQVSDAVLIDQKEYYLLFANPTCSNFSVASINLIDKTIKRIPDVLKINKDEFYLYSFVDQGQFYIFTSIRKSSSVRLYKYDYASATFEIINLSFENIKINKEGKPISVWGIISNDNKTDYDNSDIFKYTKNASAKSEIDPKIISKYLKFYQRNGHFIITIDGYVYATILIDINLATKKYMYGKLPFDRLQENSTENYDMLPVTTNNNPVDSSLYEIKENSYLFEDKLFQVKVSDKKLLVSVTDMNAREKIQRFSCTDKDSSIAFANSPIKRLIKDKFWGSEREKTTKKVKKMLETFSNHNVFIGAIRNQQNNIELMIGTFYLEKHYSPGSGASSIAGGTSSITENLQFFKSLLSTDSLEHISGLVPDSEYDKLIEAQKKLNCPSKAQLIFKIDDSYYLGYFKTVPTNENSDSPPSTEDPHYYCIEKFGK